MEKSNLGSNNRAEGFQAYFSHSYRAEDREVNLFFWELFSKEKFYFAVDPKSDKLVIPRLEMMMRDSDCFIAIVTRRLETIDTIGEIPLPNPVAHWTHSPYIVFENYLAELAGKPRLIFIERGLNPHIFGTSDCVHIFERMTLQKKSSEYRDAVLHFAKKVKTYTRSYERKIVKTTAKVGFVIDTNNNNDYSPQVISNIQSALTSGGYATEIISPNFDGAKSFIRRLSDFDLLMMDVRPPFMPLDTLGFILAKGMPSIRIAKLLPGETATQFVLPGLLKDFQIQGEEHPIITWVDKEELIFKIFQCLSKILQSNYWIDSFEQGYKYLSSTGRESAKSKGFVFISNPHSLNSLALKLCTGFQTSNILFFHYQTIPAGEEWRKMMEQELRKCNFLVALINDSYHKSEWCKYELKVFYERYVAGEAKIFPYIIEETRLPDLIKDSIQCADRRNWNEDETVQDIVATIENQFKIN